MRAQWHKELPGKKMSNKTLCIDSLPVCLRRCDAVLIRTVLPEYHPKIAWYNDRLSEAYAVSCRHRRSSDHLSSIVQGTIPAPCALFKPVQSRSLDSGDRQSSPITFGLIALSWVLNHVLRSIRHVTSRRHGRVIVSMPAFGRAIDLWSRTLGPRRKLSQMTILLRASCLRR